MTRQYAVAFLLIAVCLGALPAAQTRKPAAKPSPAAKPEVKKPEVKKPAVKPSVKKEQAVPFRPGETLTYDIGWSSYVTAGNVEPVQTGMGSIQAVKVTPLILTQDATGD